MKGVYCTLHYLVFSSLLIFYAQTIELAFGASQLKVDRQNDPTSNWVPMPSDIGQLKEERLLATIKSAQKKLVNTPKDATAWGQLGNIYFVTDGRSKQLSATKLQLRMYPTHSAGYTTLG